MINEEIFGLDESLYLAYSLHPVIVLGKEEKPAGRSLLIAVRNSRTNNEEIIYEWEPRSIHHSFVWGFSQAVEYIKKEIEYCEKSYLSKMVFFDLLNKSVKEYDDRLFEEE